MITGEALYWERNAGCFESMEESSDVGGVSGPLVLVIDPYPELFSILIHPRSISMHYHLILSVVLSDKQ